MSCKESLTSGLPFTAPLASSKNALTSSSATPCLCASFSAHHELCTPTSSPSSLTSAHPLCPQYVHAECLSLPRPRFFATGVAVYESNAYVRPRS